MQATRIIEARDHIAQAAYAAMRRVEADAALCRLSRTLRETGQSQIEWPEAPVAPLGASSHRH
jgi:hypothetical protein